MAPPATRLLRYFFDSSAQIESHAHSAEGRSLLFYPDWSLHAAIGAHVLVELGFTGSEQTVSFAGRVHARGTAGFDGAWLEIFAPRLVDEVRLALSKPRRRFRRVATDRLVQVHTPQGASVARLIDVGLGGLCLGSVNGRYFPGDELRISDMRGCEQMRARVIWARTGELAAEFVRTDAETRTTASRLVTTAIEQWAAARTVRHPASCLCDKGAQLLEPLLPRSAHRRNQAMAI